MSGGQHQGRQVLADQEAHWLISSPRTRPRIGISSRVEMPFIVMLSDLSLNKPFQTFYLDRVGQQRHACLGDLPHQDRCVSLLPRLPPLW